MAVSDLTLKFFCCREEQNKKQSNENKYINGNLDSKTKKNIMQGSNNKICNHILKNVKSIINKKQN